MKVQLLLMPIEHDQDMIAGYSNVCDIQMLNNFRVQVAQPRSDQFESAIVKLYSFVLEYQIRILCFLHEKNVKKLGNPLKQYSWKDLLENVREADCQCGKFMEIQSAAKACAVFNQQLDLMMQSAKVQYKILNTLDEMRVDLARTRNDKKEEALLQDLASSYRSDKDFVRSKVKGTCEWFLHDDQFYEWRCGPASRLLWLSASPGCGKSVLCKSLIDGNSVIEQAATTTVCYFFFKDGQLGRTSASSALAAILHQLFSHPNTASLIKYALEPHKSFGRALRDSFAELWGILMRCVKDSNSGRIVCMLDALDECQKDSREILLRNIISFYNEASNISQNAGCLKILISCRPYDFLEARFNEISPLRTVRFDGEDKADDIAHDINLVIDVEVPAKVQNWPHEERSRFIDGLKRMENRTYLWLYLTLNMIEDAPSLYGKHGSAEDVLTQTPPGVKDIYESILRRAQDRKLARTLLAIILAAREPLTLDEMNDALTIGISDQRFTSFQELNAHRWPSWLFKDTVRNLTGLLVSVYDSKLYLIHQTAREFLLEPPDGEVTSTKAWQESFSLQDAHETLTGICLQYLILHESQATDQLISDPCELPFFSYAANYWAHHYNSLPADKPWFFSQFARNICRVRGRLTELWWPDSRSWWCGYIEMYSCENIYSDYPSCIELTDLGIACYTGCMDVVQEIVMEGVKHDETALPLAALGQQSEVLSYLLENNFDIDLGFEQLGSALEVSCDQTSNFHFISLLIQNGAAINQEFGAGGTALTHCIRKNWFGKGHFEFFLQNGADVNAGEGSMTPLGVAAEHASVECMEILIKHGARVDGNGGSHANPLYRTCSSFTENAKEKMDLLLRYGANVNAVNEDEPIFCAAASSSSVECVEYLLENGACADQLGGCYFNALGAAAAAYEHAVEKVELLLRHGADVNAEGETNVLCVAAQHSSSVECVEVLLKNGACANKLSASLVNALGAAALENEHTKEKMELLLRHGADINAVNHEGLSVLSAVIRNGGWFLNPVQSLIAFGADVNVPRQSYMNALERAATMGPENPNERIDSLTKRDPGADHRNSVMISPLMSAARFSHGKRIELIELLIEHGADVDYCCQAGEGALVSAIKGFDDIKDFEGTYGFCSFEAVVKVLKVLKVFIDSGIDLGTQGQDAIEHCELRISRGFETERLKECRELLCNALQKWENFQNLFPKYGLLFSPRAAGRKKEFQMRYRVLETLDFRDVQDHLRNGASVKVLESKFNQKDEVLVLTDAESRKLKLRNGAQHRKATQSCIF